MTIYCELCVAAGETDPPDAVDEIELNCCHRCKAILTALEELNWWTAI